MSEDGEMLRCAWCHEPFRRPSPIGRTPQYCRRSHRQRAVEGRRTDRAVSAAVTELAAGLPVSHSARAEMEGVRKRGRGAVPAPAEVPTLF